MNGYVDKLYDVNSIEIPAEMLETHVDEGQVEAALQTLGLRYAAESEADTVAAGDLVYAKADTESYPDGRTILVYTGTALPGAEDAAKAVLGKKIGDAVETTLAEKKVTFTIGKILRRTPVAIDDALIAKVGVDGVTTVDGYKVYLRDKMKQEQALEQEKMITRFYLDQMINNSTYVYDEAEMDAYIAEQIAMYAPEYEAMGETVDENEMREGILTQTKQYWMAEAFAKSQGVEPDQASIEEDADRMIEMMQLMGEEVPERAEMIETAKQDAYFNAFYEYINKQIEQKMGGR